MTVFNNYLFSGNHELFISFYIAFIYIALAFHTFSLSLCLVIYNLSNQTQHVYQQKLHRPNLKEIAFLKYCL